MKFLNQKDPVAIAKGIMPDMPNDTAPCFVDGRNAVFGAVDAKPVPGQVLFSSRQEIAPVVAMRSQVVSGAKKLFTAYPKSIYEIDENGVATQRHNDSGRGSDARWDLMSWGNWTMAAPGEGEKLLLKKTTTFAEITDSRVGCKILARRSPFVLALNTDDDPSQYAWCHRDDVETWTPSTTNFAGGKIIRDMDSGLIAAQQFGAEVVAAGEDSVHLISFSGAPYYFADQLMYEGVGAVGRWALCVVGGRMYGVGLRGIWMAQGGDYVYYDTPFIREFYNDRVNRARLDTIVVWYDRANELVRISFPSGDAMWPDTELAYSPKYNNWGPLSFGRSAFDWGDVFPNTMIADGTGEVFEQTNRVQAIASSSSPRMPVQSNLVGQAGFGELGFGEGGFGGSLVIL